MAPQLNVECLNAEHGEAWSVYQADCVELMAQMPANCLDLAVYSPPFSNLYIYSESVADHGNCANDDEFLEQYRFVARELMRVMRPFREVCVHCKQLVNYRGRDGMAGLRDFRGKLIQIHVEEGWAYHSEVVIWKDPVIEMQRTKAQGLLYKQLRADSTFSRVGMPEYILVFRKWPRNEEEEALVTPVRHTVKDFPLDQWQQWASPQWASPVWTDIRQTDVLNSRLARDDKDERHICPLQLDVIERCVKLWSNEGETVFSPYMGIGSEGYQSVKFKRRFVGTELKASYFAKAVEYLREAEADSVAQLL